MATPYLSLNYAQNTAVLRQTLSVTAPTNISASSASNAITITQSGSGQGMEVYGIGSSNILLVRSGQDPITASGGAALTVSRLGNVGIGTTVPIQRAHIQGTAYLNGNVGIGAGASNPDRALVVSGETNLAGTTIAGDPLPAGLVASMSFSGHMYEDSGNSNSLIGAPDITGTPQINTSGRVGTSVVAVNPPGVTPATFFAYPVTNNTLGAASGSGATLRLSHTHPDGFAIMAWIKPYASSSTNRQFAIGGDGGFTFASTVQAGSYVIGLGIDATTNYCFASIQQSSGNYVSITSLNEAPIGSWTHIAMSCTGTSGTVSLYVNGVSAGTPSSYTTSVAPFISKILLFNAYTGAPNAFCGEIDHVQIYNKGLSAAQVAAAYASSATRAYAPAILANSLRVQGPCQFSQSTALDVFNTNTSNAAMTMQYTTQEFMGFDDSGISLSLTSNIIDYANGAVSVSRFGPFFSTLPTEGSFLFDNFSYPGSNSSFLSTPQTAAGSNAYAFNWWQSGGFTAEAWVYQTARSATVPATIVAHADPLPATISNYWSLYINTDGTITFSYYTGAAQSLSGSTAVALNTWTHIAVACDGTNIKLYVNGSFQGTAAVQLSPTPQVNFAARTPILVGQASGGNAFQGYISNLRLVKGAALYSSTFTVPTTPFPRSSAANSSTVMLLRAAQIQRTPLTLSGEGRLSITKLGGAQDSEAARPYPPVALTGSGTLVTSSNANYGLGYYTVTASSVSTTFNAYYVFDRSSLSWNTSNAQYNLAAPYNYTGSLRTIDINGTQYAGEWVQLQMPVSIRLSSISITGTSGQTTRMPSRFFLFGSQDGFSWTILGQYSGLSHSAAAQNIPIATRNAFSTYRMVIPNLTGNGSYIDINELLLYGKQEAAITVTYPDARIGVGVVNPTQALEVSGNAIISGSLSAGNMGMFRNRIINGDMRIAQRGISLTTSPISVLTTAVSYGCVDRVGVSYSITTGGIKQDQITLSYVDTPYQYGLRNSYRITANAANSSYTYITPFHVIEGYNMTDFLWGSPYAAPVSCSCWLKVNAPTGSSVSFTLRNASAGSTYWSYNSSIIVTAQAQWQLVNMTIPPPSAASTWNANSNISGIEMFIGGYTFGGLSSSANTWQQANYVGLNTNTNIWATSGNYVEFTGLQLEKGTITTPFEFRPYATELQLCQRYYQLTRAGVYQYCGTGDTYGCIFPFPVPMRISPVMTDSIIITQSGTFTAGWPKIYASNNLGFVVELGMSVVGKGAAYYDVKATAEL